MLFYNDLKVHIKWSVREILTKGDFILFQYVQLKKVKSYRKLCIQILTKLQQLLKDKLGLKSQIFLIGSGSVKLVTQNGNGPFDLDYNLTISNLSEVFDDNPKKLKEFIKLSLDTLIRDEGLNFSDGKDSTSVLTYIIHDDDGNVVFSFDLAILARINANSNFNRLINNKKQNSYVWAKLRNTKKLEIRANNIRKQGKYDLVRKIYLSKKNAALANQEDIHSFSLYAQAINEVEQKINKGGKKTMAKYNGDQHSKAENDNRSNQMNPNNPAHSNADNDNHANQMNPNHK